MSKERSSIPFLELSLESLAGLNFEGDVPVEELLNIWVHLTKSSSTIKHGKRLENISWRIVNKKLVNQGISAKKQLDTGDLKTLIEVNLKADQQKDLLLKKLSQRSSHANNIKDTSTAANGYEKATSINNSIITNNYNSTYKNVKTVDHQHNRDQNPDSEKSFFGRNLEKKFLEDIDDYQPEPKYAFGYVHKSPKKNLTEDGESYIVNSNGKPLNRSTSIVRGFSPNKISVSYGLLPKSSPNTSNPSTVASSTNSHSTTASEQNGKNSVFSSRSPSKLQVQNRQYSQPQPPAHQQPQNSSISPKSRLDDNATHKRRVNVLTNLGMTSLITKPKSNQTSSDDSNRKNMFFIESSPSPSESDLVGSTDENLFEKKFKQFNEKNEISKSGSEDKNSQFEKNGNNKSKETPEASAANHKPSLFSNKIPVKRESLYSSSESISNESEWSSISDSEISDEDEEISISNTNDNQLQFEKKEESSPRPTVKRSLLSGLFLDEMNQQLKKHEEKRYSSQHSNDMDVCHNSNVSYMFPPNFVIGPALRANTISPVMQHANINTKPVLQRSSTIGFINNSDQGQNKSIYTKENKSSIDLGGSSSINKKSVVGLSDINIMASINHTDAKESLHRQSSKFNFNQTSKLLSNSLSSQSGSDSLFRRGSIHSLISKSALNLTTYFSGKRLSGSSVNTEGITERLFRDEGSAKKAELKHSRAPATASTLLPTALTTHMFLPNAHQRAKSKLTSVKEDDISDEDVEYSSSDEPLIEVQNSAFNGTTSKEHTKSNMRQRPDLSISLKQNLDNSSGIRNLSNSSISKSISIKRGNSFSQSNNGPAMDSYTYYTGPNNDSKINNIHRISNSNCKTSSGTGISSPKTIRRAATDLSDGFKSSLLSDNKLPTDEKKFNKINIVNIENGGDQIQKWEGDKVNYHARGW